MPYIAGLARTCDKAVFLKVHDSLQRKVGRTEHGGVVNDHITEGTIADCAQALMEFLNSKCKIEHAGHHHAAWLDSIQRLVRHVLFFFFEQVCSSLCASFRSS